MVFFNNLEKETDFSAYPENQTQTIVFNSIPESAEEFRSLPQALLNNPFDTTALTVISFCLFPVNRELCYRMIDYLRGPRPMNDIDKQFISNRFMDKDYVPRSYFSGATTDNNYMPSEPYSIIVNADNHSFDTQNSAKLFITSSGADSPRPITLRKAKDGKWYLWEYSSVLLGIRMPESLNPWA